jgi:hypothetical protein
MDKLLDLPSLVLDRRTRGDACRAPARLQRLAEGVALEEEMDMGTQVHATQRPQSDRPAQYRRAHRIHHHLAHGSISRAARCLEEQPPQECSEAVLNPPGLRPSGHLTDPAARSSGPSGAPYMIGLALCGRQSTRR